MHSLPDSRAEEATFDALAAACRGGAAAALIVEPLVLGAGGTLLYGADVLGAMSRICETHGALFITNEVMTGWGRIGALFAWEQERVVPNIACYPEGLPGGPPPTHAPPSDFTPAYNFGRGLKTLKASPIGTHLQMLDFRAGTIHAEPNP